MNRFLLLIIALLSLSSHANALTEVRSIPTRPGVTLEFLFMSPGENAGKTALILFPGGNGTRAYRLLDDGAVQGWNFLVRSAQELSSQGFALAIVSPPSDRPNGMSSGFRESMEHADDVGKLAAYLAAQGYHKIFLVGNSRGTISATALAGRLHDIHLTGVILTSSLDYDEFMRWLPLEKVRLPVLMIHNREDQCRVSAFSEAMKTRDALRLHTKVDFVEVSGGATPMTLPCDNLSTHGFFGIEDKVMRVIIDWINGRKIPDKIE
ncbi:alpha/beta hydrolase family protein [Pelotalea chapellei]|uniref:Alpha/beta hydrolase n=1 Tax=Pelotalea chapellei TaxID=44671 RepID=A0ABS5U667_9BACT|nr:alpha/beta hydrolase [Pelotalea chapellei]MBT1071167.1 alpha/beta hydrolase [Pelotalea chapellei]